MFAATLCNKTLIAKRKVGAQTPKLCMLSVQKGGLVAGGSHRYATDEWHSGTSGTPQVVFRWHRWRRWFVGGLGGRSPIVECAPPVASVASSATPSVAPVVASATPPGVALGL